MSAQLDPSELEAQKKRSIEVNRIDTDGLINLKTPEVTPRQRSSSDGSNSGDAQPLLGDYGVEAEPEANANVSADIPGSIPPPAKAHQRVRRFTTFWEMLRGVAEFFLFPAFAYGEKGVKFLASLGSKVILFSFLKLLVPIGIFASAARNLFELITGKNRRSLELFLDSLTLWIAGGLVSVAIVGGFIVETLMGAATFSIGILGGFTVPVFFLAGMMAIMIRQSGKLWYNWQQYKRHKAERELTSDLISIEEEQYKAEMRANFMAILACLGISVLVVFSMVLPGLVAIGVLSAAAVATTAFVGGVALLAVAAALMIHQIVKLVINYNKYSKLLTLKNTQGYQFTEHQQHELAAAKKAALINLRNIFFAAVVITGIGLSIASFGIAPAVMLALTAAFAGMAMVSTHLLKQGKTVLGIQQPPDDVNEKFVNKIHHQAALQVSNGVVIAPLSPAPAVAQQTALNIIPFLRQQVGGTFKQHPTEPRRAKQIALNDLNDSIGAQKTKLFEKIPEAQRGGMKEPDNMNEVQNVPFVTSRDRAKYCALLQLEDLIDEVPGNYLVKISAIEGDNKGIFDSMWGDSVIGGQTQAIFNAARVYCGLVIKFGIVSDNPAVDDEPSVTPSSHNTGSQG